MNHQAQGRSFLPGRRLAAPSWVIPASLEENCRFLAGRVNEVGLLFFETKGSLAYTEQDIPLSLAALPLSFHVHLPVDLPWHEPERAAKICLALLRKVSCLRNSGVPDGEQPPPHCRGVLHPPPHDPADSGSAARKLAAFARGFADRGGENSLLLLENCKDNDLTPIMGPLLDHGFTVCLDSGHMLAYGQESLLGNDVLLQHTGMLHLSAPGRGSLSGSHLPLTMLDPAGAGLCRDLVRQVPRQSVLMAELFDWSAIEVSLPMIRSWLR
jgi:hypothetical protein